MNHYQDFYGDDGGTTCTRCGGQGLHWDVHHWDQRGREVWRLYDADGELHECNTAASSDEFEDVS